MPQDLIYTKQDGIATLVLNRPERYNAFSINMLKNWVQSLEDARNDDHVKVIVLTGAGKAFCTGGDVKSMREGEGFLHREEQIERAPTGPLAAKNSLWELIHRVPLTLEDIDKPVIAAINGPAMGAGLDMALMCDLRVAAETAVFAESYVKVGLVPGDGGAFYLPRLVGLAKALELLWMGETIDAREALRIGLVNKVVPPDELEKEAMALAARLAEGPSIAIRMIKRAVYHGLRSDLRTSLDMISSHMAILSTTEDYREGVNALLDKRRPSFQDR